jgi:uncharacterized protein (DUF2141 family)
MRSVTSPKAWLRPEPDGDVRLSVSMLAALVAASFPLSAQAQGGALVFQVDHVRDDTGHVRIDVCTQETFLREECPYFGSAPAVKGVTTVTVPNVPAGTYAAQVYHDRNDDHKVNRSRPLGIPLEEIGFSNNAPVGVTGPKWAKAAFVHDSGDQQLAVRLKHYP